MNIKFIKEKHKMEIPVDLTELSKGTWKNVTRDQIVTVESIYKDSVEYKWDGCTIKKFYYVKSKEHFLRSYKRLK